MERINKIIWGVAFIIVGLIVGTNSLNITNINIFFKGWWTLFIIIPSLVGLIKSKENITSNSIGLIIGIALFLAVRDVISLSILSTLLLPFVLIATGVSIIFKNTIKNQIKDKLKSTNINTLETIAVTFAEEKINVENEKFKGSNLDVVFGSITLNLKKATFDKDTIIKSSSIFGGIKLILPDNVNVKIKSTPIFGGVSNKVVNKVDNKKTIYIDSFTLFGGFEIK
ncbi:MAG: LiaF-related protein [Bacilli bacterium]|nr:LiaF-related protein [Bacilli bacterium]